MEEKTTIGNVCFIFDKAHKKILLLERAREPMRGLYTGVGGKTHLKESVYESCLREVLEETGLGIFNVVLKGVLKTIQEDNRSAWLLFIYTATAESEKLIDCDEGTLQWIPIDTLHSFPLIGFIKEMLPYITNDIGFLEGSVCHDQQGNVLSKKFQMLSKRNIDDKIHV